MTTDHKRLKMACKECQQTGACCSAKAASDGDVGRTTSNENFLHWVKKANRKQALKVPKDCKDGGDDQQETNDPHKIAMKVPRLFTQKQRPQNRELVTPRK